jgi:hypothetical protein
MKGERGYAHRTWLGYPPGFLVSVDTVLSLEGVCAQDPARVSARVSGQHRQRAELGGGLPSGAPIHHAPDEGRHLAPFLSFQFVL